MQAFDNSELEAYRAEAREKWGETEAYSQHEEKTATYTKETWSALSAEMDRILEAFAACLQAGNAPASPEAQQLVKALQSHITENYYQCTPEILAGLGQMYVADERFKKNIDKHAEGTAAFVCEAIQIYCKN